MSCGNVLGEVKFEIKSENVRKVLAELNNHFYNNENEESCLNELMFKFGLEVCMDDDGNVTDLSTVDSGLEVIPYDFFKLVSEYVESGCFVEFNGDEYDHYMVKFNNRKCEVITGQVIYPDATQLSYDRMDTLLNEVVSHEFIARKSVYAAENLLRIGFTAEELIKSFDVDADDVQAATRIIEEG